ncbi:hypothetical protein A374_17909 [Fictibacillus macauensis ZFHKF-1]|uniref:Uncharacterized protein n=1 Tax=Fictibacillus macauensis ZFHKF-1 TaxID=1196324 RepID=I8UAG5_9BACL|nr:hypothetical protein [Fictibacillus macauensis]EIT83935.1 hypothetical protein A374_17909 [Fictibacillus macauensis ZFHKF-1]
MSLKRLKLILWVNSILFLSIFITILWKVVADVQQRLLFIGGIAILEISIMYALYKFYASIQNKKKAKRTL